MCTFKKAQILASVIPYEKLPGKQGSQLLTRTPPRKLQQELSPLCLIISFQLSTQIFVSVWEPLVEQLSIKKANLMRQHNKIFKGI